MRTARYGTLSRKLAYCPSELSYSFRENSTRLIADCPHEPLSDRTASLETIDVRTLNSGGTRLCDFSQSNSVLAYSAWDVCVRCETLATAQYICGTHTRKTSA